MLLVLLSLPTRVPQEGDWQDVQKMAQATSALD
jgi:hypothetical protein